MSTPRSKEDLQNKKHGNVTTEKQISGLQMAESAQLNSK